MTIDFPKTTLDVPGVYQADLAGEFNNLDPIRQADIASCWVFVQAHSHLLTGRVLDYGAGVVGSCRKPQPYRSMIERPGVEYCPFDIRADEIGGDQARLDRAIADTASVYQFDSAMCTQVLQYFSDGGQATLVKLRKWMKLDGRLLLTYAVNWEEAETSDWMRSTRAGMDFMLARAGFVVEVQECRLTMKIGGHFRIPFGYGAIARAV